MEIRRHQAVRITLGTLILIAFGLVFVPLITPLILAILFAFALEPFVSRFAVKRSKRRLPTALVLFSFFLIIAGPIVLVISRLVSKVREYSADGLENSPALKSLEQAANSLTAQVAYWIEKFNLDPNIIPNQGEVFSRAGAWVVAGSTELVARFPEIILGFFIFSAALYYFLMESKAIKRFVSSLDLLTQSDLDQIITQVQKSSYTSLVVNSCIGGVQASVVSLGALICGFSEFLIIFVITFVCSFVPVIGAAPVALLLGVISFAQGSTGAGIGLLVVAVIAGTIDNILKPLMMSSAEEELHPVVSLIIIIGAIIMYGFPGLLLGPVLISLMIRILPILFRLGSTK